MNYYAVDRWSSGDSLLHYKYIKKIKIGPFTRYFYSMDDLKAYYNSLNNKTNKYSEDNLNKAAMVIDKNMSLHFDLTPKAKIDRFFNGISQKQGERLFEEDVKAQEKLDNYNNTYEKSNKLNALVKTGKFALGNLFGASTTKHAKGRYKNSLNYDIKERNDDNWSKYGSTANGYYSTNIYKGIKRKKK